MYVSCNSISILQQYTVGLFTPTHSTSIQSGTLAGVRPCGIIVLVSELFGAESVSQVYAALHTLIHQNVDSLREIGKTASIKFTLLWLDCCITSLDTICYDYGCHLKIYASKRADITETSKKISSCHVVVDTMHFRGHTNKWCHETATLLVLNT